VGRQLEGVFPVALLRYYSGLCCDDSVEETRQGLFGGKVVVRREPVGVVAAIVPWNFPQTLAAFKYAPALAAGGAVVLKPSPETVLDSYVFAECVTEAGIPDGVINIVPAGREVGAHLVAHPGIDKVSFTGSARSAGGCCVRSPWNSVASPRRSSSTMRISTWRRSPSSCSSPRC
jgi:aldehyde dehydrogenase (NAD+)